MPTLSSAINASASALSAERTRIEVAVSNTANAESTHGPDGQPYRRRDVVLAPDRINSFDAALGKAGAVGVSVAAIVEDAAPFRRRHEPSHPYADAEGFVIRVSTVQGRVGADLRTIDEQKVRLDKSKRSSTKRLSALEDANMAEAINGMAQADAAYHAALGAVSCR